jgi:hypothetical protein
VQEIRPEEPSDSCIERRLDIMTLRTKFTCVSLLALAACGSDTAGKGRVAIAMSATGASVASSAANASLVDGSASPSTSHGGCLPGQGLQAANVTLSSILARTVGGVLTNFTIDLPVTVDVLKLSSGADTTLPIGYLPPGTYDQIVVVMTKVEVTLLNGTKVAITPPGGGWTSIVPVAQPFTVVEGQTTTITLNFRKDLSFGCGSGNWEFKPRFECDGKHGG